MERIVLLTALTAMMAAAMALCGVAQAQSVPEPPCNFQYCIDKTATPSTVAVGEPITFTITERCPGNGELGCIDTVAFPIVDTLPPGLTVDSVPAACTTVGNTVTCAENRFFTETRPYTLTIVATPTECGTFTNTASYDTLTAQATYTVNCVPTTKEQCKKGGWKDFGYPDQGACISDVNRRSR